MILGCAILCGGGLWSCVSRDHAAQNSSDESSPSAHLSTLDRESSIDEALSAGLVGSKHDFSQSLEHPRDLCTPCHVPHITTFVAPLLDKRPAASDAIRPYETAGVELDSASMLCLSCHDGIVARDVFTASHAMQWADQFAGSQSWIDSAAGHPIGIDYPQSQPTYRSAASVTADGRIKLPEGRVQCISCHDPHNTGRHPGMLVRSNEGSRLCLACHRL